MRRSKYTILVILSLILAITPAVFAQGVDLPDGWNVTEGEITSVTEIDPGIYQIVTATETTIVETPDFGINPNEGYDIQQPTIASMFWFLITGMNPTNISGSITSNAGVNIVNPNGIVFSETARINVARMIASTLDISVDDIMNGNSEFIKANTSSTAEASRQEIMYAYSLKQ